MCAGSAERCCGDVNSCAFGAADDADSDNVCSDVDSCVVDVADDADSDELCGDVDSCPLDSADDTVSDEVSATWFRVRSTLRTTPTPTACRRCGLVRVGRCGRRGFRQRVRRCGLVLVLLRTRARSAADDADSDELCGNLDSCTFDAADDKDSDDACSLDAGNDLDADEVCGVIGSRSSDATNDADADAPRTTQRLMACAAVWTRARRRRGRRRRRPLRQLVPRR